MAAKFALGDKVVLNGRSPGYIAERHHRPRTVIGVRYNPQRRCCLYLLGDNYHGPKLLHWYRSYMLMEYRPRWRKVGRIRHKRQYNKRSSEYWQAVSTSECPDETTLMANLPLEMMG
mgnify:FL=1